MGEACEVNTLPLVPLCILLPPASLFVHEHITLRVPPGWRWKQVLRNGVESVNELAFFSPPSPNFALLAAYPAALLFLCLLCAQIVSVVASFSLGFCVELCVCCGVYVAAVLSLRALSSHSCFGHSHSVSIALPTACAHGLCV